MVTFGEVFQAIQSLYSEGVESDDSRLTNRHIYSGAVTARSLLIEQRYNKKQFISEWCYQTIPCVDLIPAPIHECPSAPKGCTILRSERQIPKPISGIDSPLIKTLTSLDGTIVFSPDEFETQKYSNGNKYTSKKPTFYIRNQYIYITTLKMLKAVPVSMLAEDPLEVYLYQSSCCEDCACKDIYEYQFPIERPMLKTLTELAVQNIISIMKQLPEDENNNASDDTGNVKMIHQNPG